MVVSKEASAKKDSSILVQGEVASADPATGTIALQVRQVDGMTPALNAITVLVAPDAVLRSSGGLLLKSDEFYKSLEKSGARVGFAGTYEPVTGTLRAVRARLENPKFEPSHEVVIVGTPQNVEEKSKTFTVGDPTEWQGIFMKEGKTVSIVATAATAFQDDKGGFIATPTFYESATKGENPVRILGIYADGKITATRIELLPPAPKKVAEKLEGEGKQIEATEGNSKEPTPEEPKPTPPTEEPKPAETPKPAEPTPTPEKP
jgi:hypothetical protein